MEKRERRYEAATTYDEAAYAALAYLMIRRLRRAPRLILIVLGLATVVGAAVMMLLEGRVSALWLVLLAMGNVVCMVGLLAEKFAVRMMCAANKKGAPEVRYVFREDGMTVATPEETHAYAYGEVVRVLDMSGYLFFFCRDGQVYMLRQAEMKGHLKAFRAFLEEKLTKKG